MNTLSLKIAIILFLSLSAFVSLRTAMPRFRPDQGNHTQFQLTKIKECLDLYYRTQGHYPERLKDIPNFPRYNLTDPWNIPFQYECLGEGEEYVLASIGYDKFYAIEYDEIRAQDRVRIKRHIVATACMALLIFLILFIRWRKDGHWPTWKSLPLLLSFAIGLYARLGDNGILPMRGSVVIFYALLAMPCVLAVFTLVLAIIKRDSLYFAALPVALYACLSVFALIT